jgi:hypothetical protein
MNQLRRIVLAVLLFTVPFQAALGSTAVLCAWNSHHDHGALVKAHTHDSAPSDGHHHDSGPAIEHDDSMTGPGFHGASDKCEICSECCFTAAPVPAAIHIAAPPDTPLRVPSIVVQHLTSRADDGLFRPPRITPA